MSLHSTGTGRNVCHTNHSYLSVAQPRSLRGHIFLLFFPIKVWITSFFDASSIFSCIIILSKIVVALVRWTHREHNSLRLIAVLCHIYMNQGITVVNHTNQRSLLAQTNLQVNEKPDTIPPISTLLGWTFQTCQIRANDDIILEKLCEAMLNYTRTDYVRKRNIASSLCFLPPA